MVGSWFIRCIQLGCGGEIFLFDGDKRAKQTFQSVYATQLSLPQQRPREEWCSKEWEQHRLPSKVALERFILWRILKFYTSGLTPVSVQEDALEREDSSTPAHCSFSEPPLDHLNWQVKGQTKTDYLFDPEKQFPWPSGDVCIYIYSSVYTCLYDPQK